MLLGLYVQVPFCQTKCTYCNFHTGVFSNDLYAPYVEAVCRKSLNIPACWGIHIAEVPETRRRLQPISAGNAKPA